MKNTRVPGETSLRDFLTAVGSADGAHGAVSAAAVAAGVGNSLLLMVAALPKTRSDSIEDRTMLTEAATACTELREQLIEAIETETAVKLFAARNMPQASETQRSERQTAIQFALRARADVPLEVMRLCASALHHAETVAERSSRAASGDVELAVALLRAAFDGARTNLEMKLSSLTDAAYISAVVDEIAHLADRAATSAHLAESSARRPSA